MATPEEQLQYARLRRDVGADATSLPDPDAEALLEEAAETYGTDTAAAATYARVLAIRGMLASAAKMTSYKQNNSSESASDVFKHLSDLLALWEGKTAAALAAGGGGMAFFDSAQGQRGR